MGCLLKPPTARLWKKKPPTHPPTSITITNTPSCLSTLHTNEMTRMIARTAATRVTFTSTFLTHHNRTRVTQTCTQEMVTYPTAQWEGDTAAPQPPAVKDGTTQNHEYRDCLPLCTRLVPVFCYLYGTVLSCISICVLLREHHRLMYGNYLTMWWAIVPTPQIIVWKSSCIMWVWNIFELMTWANDPKHSCLSYIMSLPHTRHQDNMKLTLNTINWGWKVNTLLLIPLCKDRALRATTSSKMVKD